MSGERRGQARHASQLRQRRLVRCDVFVVAVVVYLLVVIATFPKVNVRTKVLFSTTWSGTAAVDADPQIGGANKIPNALEATSPFTKPALLASKEMHTYGFFLQAKDRPKATLEVVKSARRFLPDAPIFLVSDGGFDFSPLVDRFNVYFSMGMSRNHGFEAHGNDAHGNVWVYLSRILRAAQACNCEYLILLEDDVFVQREPRDEPIHDAGGEKPRTWVESWSPELVDHYPFVDWPFQSRGLCGGSYHRTEALIDVLTHPKHKQVAIEMGAYMDGIGRTTDLTLAALYAYFGHTLRPWAELHDANSGQNLGDPFIVHHDTRWHGVPLSSADGSVVTPASVERMEALRSDAQQDQPGLRGAPGGVPGGMHLRGW